MGSKYAKLFKELVKEYLRVGSPPDNILQELWNKADKDKSGYLDNSEAKEFFGSLYDYLKKNDKEKLNDTKKKDCIQRWINDYDKNGDGLLHKNDFDSSLIHILGLCDEDENSDDHVNAIVVGALPCEIKRHVISFLTNKHADEVETEFKDYDTKLPSGLTLTLSVTIGPAHPNDDEHARFRTVTHIMTDYVIILFSVVMRWTFDFIDVFVEEIDDEDEGIPFVLVGVHTEKRGEGTDVITREEGLSKAKSTGAMKYYEMAGSNLEEIKECFAGSVKVFRKNKKK